MRKLSILVIFAVALQAGPALAGGKEIAQSQAHNRAKLLQHYNKLQRAYEQTQKKLNSAKYLEDIGKPKLSPRVELSPLQREAIRKLGFTAHDWDKRIQAIRQGLNQ